MVGCSTESAKMMLIHTSITVCERFVTRPPEPLIPLTFKNHQLWVCGQLPPGQTSRTQYSFLPNRAAVFRKLFGKNAKRKKAKQEDKIRTKNSQT